MVDEGLVEKKRGLGMFVRENAREQLLESDQNTFLSIEWPQIKTRIKNLKLDVDVLVKSLKEVV